MDAKFCSECGIERLTAQLFCGNCGMDFKKGKNDGIETNEGSAGYALTDEHRVPTRKKGRAAAIISILCGILSLFFLYVINQINNISTGLVILGATGISVILGCICGIVGRRYRVMSFIGLGINILVLAAIFYRMDVAELLENRTEIHDVPIASATQEDQEEDPLSSSNDPYSFDFNTILNIGETFLNEASQGKLYGEDIHIGMSYDELVRLWGNPHEEGWDEGIYIRYGDYFLATGEEKEEISNILVWLTNYNKTISDVIDALGEPASYQFNERDWEGYIEYMIGDYRITFGADGDHKVNDDLEIESFDYSSTVSYFELEKNQELSDAEISEEEVDLDSYDFSAYTGASSIVQNVSIGMDKTDVIRLLGNPSSGDSIFEYESTFDEIDGRVEVIWTKDEKVQEYKITFTAQHAASQTFWEIQVAADGTVTEKWK
ncbi:DUF4309 domain-containing protein [Bacillus coreaensis]